MAVINADIEQETLNYFRDVIYSKSGLKKGDFKNALEDAILEYILKYSETWPAKDFAKKTLGIRNGQIQIEGE